MRNTIVLAAAFAVSLTAMPAFAHHGWGGQSQEVSTMTGTVVESVKLAGPHATMRVNVDGKVWNLTLAPPARTSSAGLKPDTLPLGAKVTVMGNKNMDASRMEMKTTRVTYNDKNYNVY